MTACPATDRLEQLLEESLPEPDRAALSTHVAACGACQSSLERLTEAPAALRGPLSSARHSGPAPSELFLRRLTEMGGHARPFAGPIEVPVVPGYEILHELGRGGMGVVYRARHVGLNRTVALKMILAGDHAGPRDLARFKAEAEAVARLRHPNIVQIYDVGEVQGRPYLAFELVEGGSLVQRVRGAPQPARAGARFIEALARAIHYAHERGIVHRDLKPANILLADLAAEIGPPSGAPSGARRLNELTPKITDFGLAKRLDDEGPSSVSGEVVGTPSYMAPEQAGGRSSEIGPPADVYALGAILYELLTGKPPFKGPTALDTVLQVLHEEPARPSRLPSHLESPVPRDLEIICLKCLEKQPGKRYASAAELADDLGRFRRGAPVLARPVGPQERAWKWARRRPLIAGLWAVLVAVALLGFAGVTWQWREAMLARDQALGEKRDKDAEREQAEDARNQARAALYDSHVARSQLYWRVNDFPSAMRTLRLCLPGPGQLDPRGWEWHYLDGLYATDLFTLDSGRGTDGAVAVHPQGKWIASVNTGRREVRLWDGKREAPAFTLPASGTAHRLAFRPDGARLAVADNNGEVVVWDLAARRPVRNYPAHQKSIAGLAFSPDGQVLATASWDRTVKLWDVAHGTVRHVLEGHADRAHAVAFHPTRKRLATGDEAGYVRIWDSDKGKLAYPPLEGHKSAVYGLAFSPDGKHLASAGSNGNVRLWDLMVRPPRVVQSLTGNAGAVYSIAFSPDGRYLAYGGSDSTVRVWHLKMGVERIVFRGHTAAIESVRFTPDGRRLVSCCPQEGTVKVWDLTRHPEHSTLGLTRHPDYASGERLPDLEELKVWDLLRGTGPAPARTGPGVSGRGPTAGVDHGLRGATDLGLDLRGAAGRAPRGNQLRRRQPRRPGRLRPRRPVPRRPQCRGRALGANLGPGGRRQAARTERRRVPGLRAALEPRRPAARDRHLRPTFVGALGPARKRNLPRGQGGHLPRSQGLGRADRQGASSLRWGWTCCSTARTCSR